MMWKQAPFIPIPEHVKAKLTKIEVQMKTIKLKVGSEKLNIIYQEAQPLEASEKPFPILLLHGQAFCAQTWNDIRTLHHVAALGHRAVAVDLPGGPKSKSSGLGAASREDFLATFIQQLGLDRPIIVSPSMSGDFSLPFLLGKEPEQAVTKCRGYVPVAPVSTGNYYTQMPKCQVPAMIVFGTKDNTIGPQSTRDLRELPNSELFPMENAGHACYMNQTDQWHYLLMNFILAIEKLEV